MMNTSLGRHRCVRACVRVTRVSAATAKRMTATLNSYVTLNSPCQPHSHPDTMRAGVDCLKSIDRPLLRVFAERHLLSEIKLLMMVRVYFS